jgi:hypothetical protein
MREENFPEIFPPCFCFIKNGEGGAARWGNFSLFITLNLQNGHLPPPAPPPFLKTEMEEEIIK